MEWVKPKNVLNLEFSPNIRFFRTKLQAQCMKTIEAENIMSITPYMKNWTLAVV